MKTLTKITNIFSWIIVFFVVIIASVLVVSTFNTPVGVRVFSVLSGSMEPTIPTASLVITKSQNDYAENDVVTVRSERTAKETVTHRIVKVEKDEETGKVNYQLKGDANKQADGELVDKNRVVGKVIGHIPFAGRLVSFAQTQMGFIFLIVIPATLIAYSELMSIKNESIKLIKARKEKKLAHQPAEVKKDE